MPASGGGIAQPHQILQSHQSTSGRPALQIDRSASQPSQTSRLELASQSQNAVQHGTGKPRSGGKRGGSAQQRSNAKASGSRPDRSSGINYSATIARVELEKQLMQAELDLMQAQAQACTHKWQHAPSAQQVAEAVEAAVPKLVAERVRSCRAP